MPETAVAIRIRPARRQDRIRILALAAAFAAQAPLCGPVEPECLVTIVTALGESQTACLLVAELDGEVQGFLGGELLHWFLNPEVVFVHERAFYVTPQAQRQGIGAALVTAAEDWARAHGAVALVLSSFVGMPHVERLYTTHGYRPLETHFLKEL